jgi:hypothetical protein
MVSFEFPRELVERAHVVGPRNYWERLVEDENLLAAYKLSYLTYLQILDWQEANRYRVTPDTPAGTDVIYTDKRGEEHPAVLVAHRRNAEAWIWIASDPSNYLLNSIKLEDLRLAEGGGQ